MNEHLSLTLTIFFLILIVFVVINSSYWVLSRKQLMRVESRSVFLDWRFWIPCLVYAFVLGYRWDYAFDWWQYYNTFNDIQHGLLYRESTEKGYLLVNIILGKLGFDFYSIFIFEGFIYILSIYILLKHNKLALVFALPLIYMGCRYNCLNISRQFFAQSVLWIGFYYLLKNNKKIYWILGIIACSIHSSAYIWVIIFYFAPKLKLPSKKFAIIIYTICWALRYSLLPLFAKLAGFMTLYVISNKDYDMEHMLSDRFIGDSYSLSHTIIYFLLGLNYILTTYLLIQKNLIRNRLDYIIIMIGFFGMCLNIVAGPHEITNRFMWYFSCLYYIGWGICLSYLFRNKKIVPLHIWLLNIFAILQITWGMHGQIVSEVTGINHHYLEYKIFI